MVSAWNNNTKMLEHTFSHCSKCEINFSEIIIPVHLFLKMHLTELSCNMHALNEIFKTGN